MQELLVFKEFYCSEHSGTVQWENKIHFRAMELRETTGCQIQELVQDPCAATTRCSLPVVHLRKGSSHSRRAYEVGQRAKDSLSLLAVDPRLVQRQTCPKMHKKKDVSQELFLFFNKTTVELCYSSKNLKKIQQHLQCFEKKQ